MKGHYYLKRCAIDSTRNTWNKTGLLRVLLLVATKVASANLFGAKFPNGKDSVEGRLYGFSPERVACIGIGCPVDQEQCPRLFDSIRASEDKRGELF